MTLLEQFEIAILPSSRSVDLVIVLVVVVEIVFSMQIKRFLKKEQILNLDFGIHTLVGDLPVLSSFRQISSPFD